MKKKISRAVGLAICACFLKLATTHAAIINFDELSVTGGTTLAPVNQYQSQGSLFNRQIPIEAIAVTEPSVVSAFTAIGGTLPNVLYLNTTSGLQIDMSFVVPGTSVPAVTSQVSALFLDTETGTTLGTIDAFDSLGNLLKSTTAITPVSEGQILSVSAAGIARVRFSTDADGADMDNISFATPFAVPEPSSLALLGLGAVAMLRRRRSTRTGV